MRSTYAKRRIWSPAVVATAPTAAAVEKSSTPLTNQKVRIDGANRHPCKIAARCPEEYENSCERRSPKLERSRRPMSTNRAARLDVSALLTVGTRSIFVALSLSP
jgi:hypothetical protein